MSLVKFVNFNTTDIEVGKILSTLNPCLASISSKLILDGVKVPFSFPVANTETKIAHNLQHIPNGFIVVDINASATVWRSSTSLSSQNDANKFLYLKASAISSGSLWVF